MKKISQVLVRAIHTTWQAIGCDAIAAVQECGEEMGNEEAVEMCLDADRVATFGGKDGQAAQDEFRALVAEYGYVKSLSHVASSLPQRLM